MGNICSDYYAQLGWTNEPGYLAAGCCDSCHEDHDEFGYELCMALDDLNSEVCCRVAQALDELPVSS